MDDSYKSLKERYRCYSVRIPESVTYTSGIGQHDKTKTSPCWRRDTENIALCDGLVREAA